MLDEADAGHPAAKALRVWMAERNMGTKELASALDSLVLSPVHPSWVSRWRRGWAKPTRPQASALAVLTDGALPVSLWDAP